MVFGSQNELCLAIIYSTIILGLHMLVIIMHCAIAHSAVAPVLSSSMALQIHTLLLFVVTLHALKV